MIKGDSMNFYKITPFKVFLKTKEELLKLGYEDNNDKTDFLNLMTGHVVTIELESEDGKMFISKEYPSHIIYDYLIKGVVKKNLSNEDVTLKEISQIYNVTAQAINGICTRSLKKLKKYIENNNIEFSTSSNFS